MVRSMAWAVEKIWKTFGIKSHPPITRFTAAIMSRDCTINDGLARREMGYEPVMSVDDGMQQLRKP
jgi:hypothetical protein